MVGATLTGLTLAGHAAAGGGALPNAVGFTVVVALALGLCACVARGPLRPVRVLALLLAGQGLAHVVLTVTEHHGAGAAHPALAVMVVAHATAAAVAALALVYADRLVDRWLTLWSTLLGTPAPVGPACAGPNRPVPTAGAAARRTRLLRYEVARRGPPVGAFAP